MHIEFMGVNLGRALRTLGLPLRCFESFYLIGITTVIIWIYEIFNGLYTNLHSESNS